MSKQANTKLIGGFVLGAVALVVAGVLIFGTGKFLKKSKKFVLFFEGSVKGLNVGAQVDFRGVKVGSVTDIRVQLDNKDLSLHIPVFIEIDPDRITAINSTTAPDQPQGAPEAITLMEVMVKRGLRAQLGMQSLVTGQLYVLLDFFPDKPVRLLAHAETGYQELPTVPSNLEELTRTFEKLPLDELASKLVSSIQGIERFVNSPDLKEAVAALNQSVQGLQTLIRNVGSKIDPLATNLDRTLTEAHNLLANLDRQLKPLLTSVERTVKDADGLVRHVDERVGPLSTSLENTSNAAGTAMKQAEQTLSALEAVVGEDSALNYDLRNTLREMTAAARSLRTLTDYLDRHPEALLRGKSSHEGK
jgi:paraquat-inducible protein B